MTVARLREQDGLIANSIKLLAFIVVFFIVILDIFSLFAAQRTVRGNAFDAASAAQDAYYTSTTQSEPLARSAATALLQEKGSVLVEGGFSVQRSSSQGATFSVTATRHAKTYVAHYLTGVPGIGPSIKRWLDPVATGTSVRE